MSHASAAAIAGGRPELSSPPQHPDDARLVLSGRPLNPAYRLDQTARFGQDTWDLTPVIFQQHVRALMLNFAPFPDGYRQAVKQLCLAMLSGQLPPNETRPSALSLRRYLTEFKRFTTWLNARFPQAPLPLRSVTLTELAAYAGYLDTVVSTPASREVAEVAVRLFWRYRSAMPDDQLIVDPLDADRWGNSTRRARGENSSERIAEDVMGPLLTWCLRFVDDFAADIIGARQHWQARRNIPRRSTRSPGAVHAQLQAVLNGYLDTGRPLPGQAGTVNYSALAREVGCVNTTLTHEPHRSAIAAAASRVGISSFPSLGTPVTATVDGQPWLTKIGSPTRDPNGAVALSILLQTACYITIAYLSGMRDSEIKNLRRGCVRTYHDSAGRPYRWTITSLAFKGEAAAGVTATWVIGAAAARAVDVLERLQPSGERMLFRSLGGNIAEERITRAQNNGRTNRLLRHFVAWVNAYCRGRGRTDTIPDDTAPLQTRQFRRTLAWHIARRPGGAIAGAIQYRHLSIQMFEGYAGTSASGFRAEVEAEHALARGEYLLDTITGHHHTALTGPARVEATRRLEAFATYTGTIVTDPGRLARLMRRHDPHLYPGTYATCVFDPAKAMCRPRPDDQGVTRPAQTSCQPLDCRNTALTISNRQALQEEATRLDAALAARPLLPPLLAHQVRDRRDRIARFLERHTAEEAS
jgi:hypothetical protein